MWKDFFFSSSNIVLKNAMVSFKLSNQTWNDNIRKLFCIVKFYTKKNLVAGVLNLLNKIWRKKMFYNWSSTVKTFLLSLIMNIWVLLIGNESLICRKEKENTYDPLAVAIIRGNVVVRHVPQNICCFFLKFLSLPNTSILARVMGKRVSCGAGYGLEIPVCFVFQVIWKLLNG